MRVFCGFKILWMILPFSQHHPLCRGSQRHPLCNGRCNRGQNRCFESETQSDLHLEPQGQPFKHLLFQLGWIEIFTTDNEQEKVGNHHVHPLNLRFQVSQMFYVKSSKLDHRFLLSLKWCGYRNCGICPHGNTWNICSFIAGEPGNFGKPESSRIESCLKSYSFHVQYLELGLMVQKGDIYLEKTSPLDHLTWGFFGIYGEVLPNVPPPQ